MKKIVILALGLLFVFSLAALFKTDKNANAAEENPNIIITTNYNQERLLAFEAFNDENVSLGVFSNDSELVITNYFETVDEIWIFINQNAYKSEYFDDDYLSIEGVFVGEDEILPSGNLYIVEGIEPETITEIEIRFNIASFEISSACINLKTNNVVDGVFGNNFIEFYTVSDKGIETKLEKDAEEKYWVQYNQKLHIKLAENITLNNNEFSYNLNNLYINFFNQNFLAGNISDYSYTVNADFLYYYFVNKIDKKINFLAYYMQNYKFTLDFNNKDLAVDYYVKNTGTNAAVGKDDFLKIGDVLQITMQLKDYTILKKLANDDRYNIGGLNYTSDEVTVNGDNVTIVVEVFDRNINLVINLELLTFEANDEGSIGKTTFTNKNFKYGDKVEITALMEDSFSEIKSWKIGGKIVPSKVNETANGIKRISENTVEIDTAVWYDIAKESGFNLNLFKSEIVTGMKSSMLMIIIISSGAVVIAGVVLLLIILLNNRTKKKIEVLLKAEKMTGYTYNTGSMIQDLKNDSFNKVSKKEIKEEMKKRKK